MFCENKHTLLPYLVVLIKSIDSLTVRNETTITYGPLSSLKLNSELNGMFLIMVGAMRMLALAWSVIDSLNSFTL